MANIKKKNAGKFEITGVDPGLINWRGINIDLSILDDEGLENLYNQGCPYIQPVGKDAPASEV